MDDWKLQVDGGLDDGLEDGGYDDMDGPDMGPHDEGAAIRARYGVPQPVPQPVVAQRRTRQPPKTASSPGGAHLQQVREPRTSPVGSSAVKRVPAKAGRGGPRAPGAAAPSGADPSSAAARGADAGLGWEGGAAAELDRLSRQNEQLIDRIAGKDIEIERLEQTLLAVEAPPGMDVGRMLDAAGGGASADVRDAKIVDLAKRNRDLARTVGKAKRAIAEARRAAAEAEARAAAAEDEAAAAAAGAAHRPGGAGSGGGGAGGDAAAEERRLQAQARAARGRMEGMQHRLDAAQAEAKAARRALAAEVGPGEELEAVLAAAGLASATPAAGGGDDGDSVATGATTTGSPGKRRLGWRGRAQRIVKLKAKVAELQRSGTSQGGAGAGGRGRTDVRGQVPVGVDDQARAVLGAMEGQRQRAAEEVSHQRAGRTIICTASNIEAGGCAPASPARATAGSIGWRLLATACVCLCA